MNKYYYMILLVLFSLSSFILSSCEKMAPSPDAVETAEIHIIIGQTNSIGRAAASQLPPELRNPLVGSFIFNPKREQFEPIYAGVNTQSESGYFGPVVKAAQLLRDYKQKDVYFIVAGIDDISLSPSGNSIDMDWHPSSNELFARTKKTIEDARFVLAAKGKKAVFKSITWWQGESDSLDPAKAVGYLRNESALFASFDQVPYLSKINRVVYKIFPVKVALPYYEIINSSKVKRAATDMRTVAVIETKDYERITGNKIHATTKGQLQAGTDLFNAIKDL